MKLFWVISVDFDVMYKLLIEYSAFVRCRGKWDYSGTVDQSYVGFCLSQERIIVQISQWIWCTCEVCKIKMCAKELLE